MAKSKSRVSVMDLKKVAREALDAARLSGVITMDGSPDALRTSGNAGGWLQAHDDRYHGGHYEEGQTCRLRDKLKAADDADRLEGATNGMTNALANAPTQEQYTALITSLRERGILDPLDTNDLLEMYHSLQSDLVNGDEDGFELSDDLKNNIRDIYDVYQALSDAYGDSEGDEGEERPAEAPEEGANENADRLADDDGNRREDLIRDNIRELDRQFTDAQREQSVNPETNGPTEEQIGTRSPDWLSDMNVEFGDGEVRRRKAENYEWPFNARHPVTADVLNEEMLRNIVCHLPFGVRSDRRLDRCSKMAMELLKNPDSERMYGHTRILDSMIGSNNRHAQRYVEALKALHPGCIEAREQRIRDNTNRHDANSFTLTMERTDSRGDGLVPNLTEEQYREAEDSVVSHVGEANRDVVARGFAAFRRGRISPQQVDMLGRYLPGNSPVLAEARRISNARMSDYDRERARILANRPHINPPKASEDVVAQDKALAESAGILFKGAGAPLTQSSGYRHFGSGSSNCWHNANAVVCQFRGMDVFPKMEGHDLMSFGSCKLAMSEAYDRVDVGTPSHFMEWLHSTQFSNGDAISTWSGVHNKVFVFNEGSWYEYDGYGNTFGSPANDIDISGAMSFISKDQVNLDGSVGGYYYGTDRQKNVILLMAKRELRKASGNMSLNPSDAEVEDKAKEMLARSQGSYFIPISKPLIPEMLKSNMA